MSAYSPGQLVRLCSAPVRIWEVRSIDGNWAELLHRETGSRCQITVSSLMPADPTDVLPEPEYVDLLRGPSILCLAGILCAAAFVTLHVWAAIRVGRSSVGLDPVAAAVAIASSGAGWTTWFGTLLWLGWRGRR